MAHPTPAPSYSTRGAALLARGIDSPESYDLSPLLSLPLPRPVTCDLCGCPCATALLIGWTFGEDGATACWECEARALATYTAAHAAVPLAETHPDLAAALKAGLDEAGGAS